jgi:hypothetical protein
MNIAAEINNNQLTVFIEGQPWQSLTALFSRENIKVERIVYMEDDPVFHDTITCPGKPETHKRLAFCKNVLSIDALIIKLEQAGFGEPYEVRLGNDKFTIDKIFTDAYTLSFTGFENNQNFLQWLISAIPSFEVDNFMRRLRAGGRYYNREFSAYKDFADLNRFAIHRCELWQAAVVKEYESALLDGTARCEGCAPNHSA